MQRQRRALPNAANRRRRSPSYAFAYRVAALGSLITCSSFAESVAELAFREGKALLRAGRIAEACAKFDESHRAEASAGTLLNLGDCREKNGELLKAYRAYVQAEPMSRARGKAEWAETAKERAHSLYARVPKLVAVLEEHETIKVDGRDHNPDDVRAGLLVEVGAHTVEVRKGDGFWSHTFDAKERTTSQLPPRVFTIVESPKPDPVLAARPWQRPLGIALLATGGAAVATSVVFGLLANGKKNEAADLCGDYATADVPTCRDRAAIDFNNSAKNLATVSTVSMVAGGVLVAAGAIVFIAAPSSTVQLGGGVGPSGGYVSYGGRF